MPVMVMVIVERICERMNWQFEINNSDYKFIAVVEFGTTKI